MCGTLECSRSVPLSDHAKLKSMRGECWSHMEEPATIRAGWIKTVGSSRDRNPYLWPDDHKSMVRWRDGTRRLQRRPMALGDGGCWAETVSHHREGPARILELGGSMSAVTTTTHLEFTVEVEGDYQPKRRRQTHWEPGFAEDVCQCHRRLHHHRQESQHRTPPRAVGVRRRRIHRRPDRTRCTPTMMPRKRESSTKCATTR